ncbi:MAG: 3'(2'),5'-bisphosphate nucleotidase [Calditrichaeota bacterium]|nr:3'(2'),5'-bisphosphate nucleotidase [Calditrichota bacterium]
MQKHLEVAIKAVQTASEICRKIQAQLVAEDAMTKKDRSPVTVADFASQAVICRMLNEAFPQTPIVAEEDAQSLRNEENRDILEKIQQFLPGWSIDQILERIDLGNGEPADEFWTLDPIDGTKGFLRKDQYAVALALIRNGEPVLGALGCPNLAFSEHDQNGTLMFSVKGEGTFTSSLGKNGRQKVTVSSNAPHEIVRFLESVEAAHSDHSLQAELMRHFGGRAKSVRFDSQVKYAVLARGDAEVYLRLPNPQKPDYREKIWDHAAGVIIVREAGGIVTDMFGKELKFCHGKKLTANRGIVVTNGKLHEQIITLLNR